MYSQFAPMGTYTLQFAKDYRAEQIRHAEQSRLAAQFRAPRKRVGRRRATWVSTIAGRTCAVAITLAVAACGSAQGTFTDREARHTGQHAAADDVAAQIEHRKAALSQETGRPQHAPTDDVERWIDAHKLILGKH